MLRLRIIALLFGLAFIADGWHEARQGFKYRKPVSMSCQELIDAKSKPAWVSVDDCVVYLGQFQGMEDPQTKAVVSMAVLVFPSVEAARDKSAKTSVLIRIDDSIKRGTVNANLDKLNAMGKPRNDAEWADFQARYKMLFESGPLILKLDEGTANFGQLQSRLTGEPVTYGYSSLADKASIGKGILTLLGGVLIAAATVASFFWKKKS